MKKIIPFLLAPALVLLACNSNSKDSVVKADSTNQSRMDSASGGNRMDTATNQGMNTVNPASTSFMVEAANGGMAEVKMGELAQQKASSADVKDFGALMVKDHTAVNEIAKSLAGQKNITLPATVGDDEQKMIDNLSQKSGKDFDKAYVDMMVDDHEKDVSGFEKASSDLKDTDIRAFAATTLPTLKTHLEKIRAIKKNMK